MTQIDLSKQTPQKALKLLIVRDYDTIAGAARELDIARSTLNGIVNGDRISPAHAQLFEDKFDIPAESWGDRLKR